MKISALDYRPDYSKGGCTKYKPDNLIKITNKKKIIFVGKPKSSSI